MSDANVVKLLQPGSFADPLTEVLRNGARALLAQAIEAEVAEFLAKHVDLKTATGLSRVVRHGHLPEREVMTGIGPVGVRQPRVRDRGAADDAGRIRFTPAILPPYARRSRSLEVLVPILYLKGISTGDFEEALAALLGKDAPGLSASTIARLKEVWIDEHEHWRKRDLSAKHYVYVWADGIYLLPLGAVLSCWRFRPKGHGNANSVDDTHWFDLALHLGLRSCRVDRRVRHGISQGRQGRYQRQNPQSRARADGE